MTNKSNTELVDQLLPALPHVAQIVQKTGLMGREQLRPLLGNIQINEELALDELEAWVNILSQARENFDDLKYDTLLHSLMQRGIPQAPAHLAIAVVFNIPDVESRRGDVLPLQISKHEVSFGELPLGEASQTTLVVSGGPGHIVCQADMLTVQPTVFGSQPTTITLSTKGGSDGQMLWGTLIFENTSSRIEVEVSARWSASVPAPHLDELDKSSKPSQKLVAHTPWMASPNAERHLFLKLFLIAIAIAALILLLVNILSGNIST